MKRCAGLAAVACVCLIATAAWAGTAESDEDDDLPDTSRSIFDPEPARDWDISIGARTRLVPAKVGSRKPGVVFGPTVDIKWRDLIFANTDRGLGINLVSLTDRLLADDRFVAGASVNADSEKSLIRSQAAYRSLDFRTRYAPYALGFMEYRSGGLRFYGEAASFFDQNNGNVFTTGAEYALPLTSKWGLTLAGTLSYADGQHMRENFGFPAALPATLPAATGQHTARLKSGFRDATMTSELEYEANRHWSYSTLFGYTRLLGQAAESHRVQTRSQPFATLGVKHTF